MNPTADPHLENSWPANLFEKISNGRPFYEPIDPIWSEALEFAISKLPTEEQCAIRQLYRDGRSFRDVAESWELSIKAIELTVDSAIKCLRNSPIVKVCVIGMMLSPDDLENLSGLQAKVNAWREQLNSWAKQAVALQNTLNRIDGDIGHMSNFTLYMLKHGIDPQALKKPYAQMEIRELGLSNRICLALGRQGYLTVAQLLRLSDDDLLCVRQIGESACREIVQAVLRETGRDLRLNNHE